MCFRLGHTNRKLELEVQVRSKIEKKLTGFQNYLNSIIDAILRSCWVARHMRPSLVYLMM